MAAFKCPHCREETLSLKDKYRLGWWATLNCSKCGGRVAAFPWVLLMMTMLYVWNLLWWVGMMNFKHSYHYLGYLVLCWVLLDLINIYFMPLCRLKKKAPG